MTQETKNSIQQFIQSILWIVGIMFIYLLIFPPFSFPRYVAWYNSKNPENILEGCLHYAGKDYKHEGFYRLKIKNYLDSSEFSISSIDSPIASNDKKREAFFQKIFQEKQRKKCYKVKYVTGRFSYLKNAYLYDIVE